MPYKKEVIAYLEKTQLTLPDYHDDSRAVRFELAETPHDYQLLKLVVTWLVEELQQPHDPSWWPEVQTQLVALDQQMANLIQPQFYIIQERVHQLKKLVVDLRQAQKIGDEEKTIAQIRTFTTLATEFKEAIFKLDSFSEQVNAHYEKQPFSDTLLIHYTQRLEQVVGFDPESDKPVAVMLAELIYFFPLLTLNEKVADLKIWLDRFIHDVRSPLSAIILFLDMMKLKPEAWPVSKAASRIDEAVPRIEELLSDLMQILSVLNYLPEKEDRTLRFWKLNPHLTEFFAHWNKYHANLRWEPDPAEPEVIMTIGAFKEILNSVAEALKTMGQLQDGGRARLFSQKSPQFSKYDTVSSLCLSTLEIEVPLQIGIKSSALGVQQQFIQNFMSPLKTGLLNASGAKVKVKADILDQSSENSYQTLAKLTIRVMFDGARLGAVARQSQ